MKRQFKILVYLALFITINSIMSPIYLERYLFSNLNYKEIIEENDNNTMTRNPLISSTQSNYEIIEDTFAYKLDQYSSLNFFPQIYESSLQATFFALYILEALGGLDEINQSATTYYILSHYNVDTHIFMDAYAGRYLDTDFSQCYYPYNSILEINCYAILSLSILGQLDLINSQESIDFIWSCYNPEGSENGFIGQPYNSNLHPMFKIATMDNTYYALRTLDLLLDDWNHYNDEKARIGQYFLGLQSSNGDFYNDNTTSFDSLQMWEPNLLSSYYCIKSLDLLNLVSSISIANFHQFLTDIYDTSVDSFNMFDMQGWEHLLNIVATALGLELSGITGFTSINRNEVINFLKTNRNNYGNWDSSTVDKNHELMDTFQIIRCLKESGEIHQLTLQEKNQIKDSINMYKQYKGFSLISHDYMSIDLIHSIINCFDLFNSISVLNVVELYNLIDGCFQYFGVSECFGFAATTNLINYIGFRSYPIEYYNLGYHRYNNETDGFYNHKFNYKALDSLLKIDNLDDFSSKCNLIDLINNILDSQFLEPDFENYGAFLPFLTYSLRIPESQNTSIFFEYSYYAIKTLELLVSYLDLGNIVDLSFNKGALYGYIRRNLHETDSIIYFNSQFPSDLETILQYTYYTIYILKALNLFDLSNEKLKEFVLQSIDYNNIKNIYYSYKISELLNFEIDFNAELISKLVKVIYIENSKEFYETIYDWEINQEIFLWICEMARNSELYIECNYNHLICLGSVNTITTYFSNLIFQEFGELTAVIFESEQLGILNLEKQFDNSYQINFLVPEDPRYHPFVEGTVFIYDHSEIIGQVPVYFQTYTEHSIEYNILESEQKKVKFDVNISRMISNEFQAVDTSIVRIQIFRNGYLFETQNFSRKDYSDYSEFSITYECKDDGNYYFNITLVDNFFPRGLFLFDYEIQSNSEIPLEPIDPIEINGMILAISAVFISVFAVLFTIFCGRKIKQRIYNGRAREEREKYESQIREKKWYEEDNNNEMTFADWD